MNSLSHLDFANCASSGYVITLGSLGPFTHFPRLQFNQRREVSRPVCFIKNSRRFYVSKFSAEIAVRAKAKFNQVLGSIVITDRKKSHQSKDFGIVVWKM